MKRAIIVLGPESSGTRYVTRVCIQAGANGRDGHRQYWDDHAPEGDVIVWRRSVPHAGQYPDLVKMRDHLRGYGYEDIRVVVTVRAWWPNTASQVIGQRHADSLPNAHSQIARAYLHIMDDIARAELPYVMFIMTPTNGQQGLWLLSWLGLDTDNHFDVTVDTDRKYWDQWQREMA